MIIANLIGYGTGYKGLLLMLKQIEENQGMQNELIFLMFNRLFDMLPNTSPSHKWDDLEFQNQRMGR